MFKKINHFLLLGVILASTLASTFLFTNEAYAAPPGIYISPQVKADANASALRTTLALCLTYNDQYHLKNYNHASASDIAKGDWFQESSSLKARAGYIADPSDGTIQCQNLFKDRNVAGAFGFKSNIELACAIGLKRDNNQDCLHGSGGNFVDTINGDEEEIYRGLDAKYHNNSGGEGYNQIQDYVLAAESYRIACKGQAVVELDKANDDQKNNSDYHKVRVINSKGESTDVLYKRSNDDKHAWKNKSGGSFDYLEQKCSGFEAVMNSTAPEYSAYIRNHQGDVKDRSSDAGVTADDSEGGDKTSCKIEGIGWIVCPAARFMAKVVDGSYSVVANLLTVPEIETDMSKPLYQAWSIMRNFANVAFVIAFLIIIYSQITGAGVSNYGIKRMLPRLIIAAILVNVSFWICAVAVDISNILGTSIKGLFDGVSKSLYATGTTAQSGAGGVWDLVTDSVLAGTAVVGIYLALPALLPLLVTALFAIVMVLLTLTLRQALIIILIVISPLAFVAYLLPNTESLFKKWRNLFQIMLLLFPIVGILFGGCSLAATILTGSAGGNWFISLMGAGVGIIPLAVTPLLIKTTSGIAGRWGGYVNNPNKGPFDSLKKRAENYGEYVNNKRGAKVLSGTSKGLARLKPYKRNYRRELRNKAASDGLQSAQAQFGITDRKAAASIQSSGVSSAQTSAINAANNRNLINGIASNPSLVSAGMGAAADDATVQRALTAQQNKAIADAIRDAEISANILPGDLATMSNRLVDAVRNNNSIEAQAMQNMLLRSGGPGIKEYRNGLNRLEGTQTVSGVDAMESTAMTDMRLNLQQVHGGIKAAAADLMAHAASGGNLSDVSNNASTWNLSDDDLVHQKAASIELAMNSGAVSAEQAKRIIDNEDLARYLTSSVRTSMKALASTTAPTPPPSPSPTPTPPPTPPGGPTPPPAPGP